MKGYTLKTSIVLLTCAKSSTIK